MKTLIALAILCSAATYARADDCKATGKPVFTIDAVDMGKVTSTTKLYDSGAWTVDASSGCADKAIAAKVKTLVSKAPWTISHPVHCMMATSKWTNYYTEGKLLFSERACNPDKLDDVSEQNLAEIVKLVTAATQPVAGSCKPTGAPVFTIDALDRGKVTSSAKLFTDGAWTVDAKTGCADKAIAAKVQTLVTGAPWKISHPIHCEMMTTTSTNYYAGGKLLFTERACNPDQLDDVSEHNLHEIVKLVGAAIQPVATSCKPEGDVVFEMAKKANPPAKVQTSTMRVYATGAWTSAAREADGSAGATRSGCLDNTALARIADDVKTAPWTVTIPRVRCMARSQTFVEYSVHGKVVFEQQVCGKTLDQDSANKLADIEAILTKL